ncbi:hypothetical protein [Noviherbaspirillum denitrificans]|uniref:Uncharacterized protein n=1 Tax=Noviherbaspirillum denitrificans TaxID=1968433 RepID=A0A254TKV5_9BURK|nr:hypothetical protein [Noviherbaspirillum denitrificans]OWW21243.1 hypothetical protein AYR66_18975 [Noviherbaspirillum denitrificans]
MKHHLSRKSDARKAARQNIPASPFAGKPMDGSQYIDVIEEQEYADRRPSEDENRPRYSYMHQDKDTKN